MTSEKYMLLALKEAQKAFLSDEVPVGALIIDEKTGTILSKAHNKTEHGFDPTAHAEILCIRKACQKIKQKRLWDCTLVVTLEPCTMCAAAISMARISKVIIGALDEKNGAVLSGVKFFESATCHFKPEIETGVLEQECAQILKDFFKSKR